MNDVGRWQSTTNFVLWTQSKGSYVIRSIKYFTRIFYVKLLHVIKPQEYSYPWFFNHDGTVISKHVMYMAVDWLKYYGILKIMEDT